jgi:hypothetical protein
MRGIFYCLEGKLFLSGDMPAGVRRPEREISMFELEIDVIPVRFPGTGVAGSSGM